MPAAMRYNKNMDRRTVITLGFIMFVIIGAFAFLIFNPHAQKAMQKNLDESTNQAAQEAGLDAKLKSGR